MSWVYLSPLLPHHPLEYPSVSITLSIISDPFYPSHYRPSHRLESKFILTDLDLGYLTSIELYPFKSYTQRGIDLGRASSPLGPPIRQLQLIYLISYLNPQIELQ